MGASFADAALDDLGLLAQADGRLAELIAEVLQARTAQVAKLDPLQVVPDTLVRVQVRGVRRQGLHLQPGSADLRELVAYYNADRTRRGPWRLQARTFAVQQLL